MSIKSAVSSLKAPLAPAKAHPVAYAVVTLAIILLAYRFRSQIMGALGRIPLIGSAANKVSGGAA